MKPHVDDDSMMKITFAKEGGKTPSKQSEKKSCLSSLMTFKGEIL